MKKCPNCGTVMDDSKVKCYACGTVMQRPIVNGSSASFNENIGAAVSNNSGTAFNNSQIENNVFGQNSNSFTGSNFSNSLYNSQLNSLNSMAYDNRTALEKMFSSDDRFKSKSEINAQKALKENQKRNNFVDLFNNSTNNVMPSNKNNTQSINSPVQNVPQMQNIKPAMPVNNVQPDAKQKKSLKSKFKKKKDAMPVMNNMAVQNNMPVNNTMVGKPNANVQPMQQVPIQPVVQNMPQMSIQQPQVSQKPIGSVNQTEGKPPINWGNDLVTKNNQGNFKKKNEFKINTSLIFNVVALIVSICGVLFVYFKFIKHDDNGRVETLNGLKYSIGDNFSTKDERNNYHLYTYGEYCSVSITSGATNDVDSYVDNLYSQLKEKYESENFNVQRNQAKYNDNIWTEIKILNFSNNAAVANGYSTKTKIQFVAIVYEGNYYTIAYQNTNNDSICSASYDTFLKTLSFK